MTPRRPTVVMLARDPRVGVGKRRLAQDVGDVAAWRIGRAMASGLARRVCDPRWRTVVMITPDRAARASRPGLWPVGVERRAQGGGDLGARIERATGLGAPCLVIGTDTPDVGRADLAAAFALLRRHPVVVGPAPDGGFWLLGVRAPLRSGALDGVRWSSAQTLTDVVSPLAAHGAIARLRVLADVDTLADWRARPAGARPQRPRPETGR